MDSSGGRSGGVWVCDVVGKGFAGTERFCHCFLVTHGFPRCGD